MLPDVPKTSERKMSLPTVTTSHNRLSPLSPPTTLNSNELFDNSNEMHIAQIMPGIYFSNTVEFWTPERLRSHGFTHIINIDKHISTTSRPPIASTTNKQNVYDVQENCPAFEILDLNFGEASYLMTVLPNCYKAVKFIDKALQNGGAILVIDQFSDQKCLTIVIGYLMYKNNINFNDAFQRVKKVFKKAELERFFISQLYEYEPILQVERAQSRGHSCSRELRSAQLKRKKLHDDNLHLQNDFNCNYQHHLIATTSNNLHSEISGDVIME